MFVLWLGMAVAVFGWMGKLPCGLSRGVMAERAWAEPGWQAVHWLTADSTAQQVVARHLAFRGPLAGLAEQVVLEGSAGDFAELLRDRGWDVEVRPGAPARSPGVRLLGPDGEVAWDAQHDLAGLEVAAAAPLDTAAFRAIAAGDALPPIVPAGCGL